MIGLSRYQRSAPGGFSLIELMISLTLGLLVLGMVLTVYLSSMNAYLFQNGVLRVQENGRFAVDVLSRTVRMAGYLTANPVKGSADAASAVLTQTDCGATSS
jgi:prepilin-type N-terminal cleavage/methylation domain-containing protein